jgi:2'-hydroxyisoflavone reductase
MRVLILGGTSFLSKAVAAEAVRRSHDVVCAARGESGSVPDGARLLRLDRDEPGSIQALAGERFDAVVDVAKMATDWVREALHTLGSAAGHWTYVSSINAYADTATMHQQADAALLDPITDRERMELAETTPELYGAVKVASENAVREVMGERAFVVRPGLITGPGDHTDRFGYWPGRFSRGAQVVVPDTPEQPIQHIDVRDLAAWIVTAGEQRISGSYDGVGPTLRLGQTLREIADLIAPKDSEIVGVSPTDLAEAGVQPWAGPKSLPLWLPESHHGLAAHDGTRSVEAGLRVRPLADTVHAALVEERALGLDRPREAGLTTEEEVALLGDLSVRSVRSAGPRCR